MCLNIVLEIIYYSLLWGGLFNNSYVGGSVAKAKLAKVSIIRFIHNIWIGLSIYCLINAAPIKVMQTATTLTVSWNWMNFLIES